MEKKQNNKKDYGNSGGRNGQIFRKSDEADEDYGIVAGRNAVRELLKSGRPVDKIYVAGREGSVLVLIAEAKKAGIPVVDADSQKLD